MNIQGGAQYSSQDFRLTIASASAKSYHPALALPSLPTINTINPQNSHPPLPPAYFVTLPLSNGLVRATVPQRPVAEALPSRGGPKTGDSYLGSAGFSRLLPPRGSPHVLRDRLRPHGLEARTGSPGERRRTNGVVVEFTIFFSVYPFLERQLAVVRG
ncbi:unnamed protein product, partial [Ascophyllum nodosum]